MEKDRRYNLGMSEYIVLEKHISLVKAEKIVIVERLVRIDYNTNSNLSRKNISYHEN